MTDPRVERLGSLIVDYSLALKGARSFESTPSRSVRRSRSPATERRSERARTVYECRPAGLGEELLHNGSEDQVTYISPIQWEEIEQLDALVTICRRSTLGRCHASIPTGTRSTSRANRKLSNRRWERISKGEMSWCGTLFPTNGHAQEAEMSLAEYEDFVFAACHVHEEDAASHWRGASAGLSARAPRSSAPSASCASSARTDLRLGVGDRSWLAADGRYNMPDGEVFTSPIETETEGEIRYTFPAVYHGREVEDIRLRFEEGRVVQAEASRGNDYLQSLLEMDPGARVLGEVAFGLNYEIDRFTRNIPSTRRSAGRCTWRSAPGSSRPGQEHVRAALGHDL